MPGIKVDSIELIELLEVIKHAKETIAGFNKEEKNELFPLRCTTAIEDLDSIGKFFSNRIKKINSDYYESIKNGIEGETDNVTMSKM